MSGGIGERIEAAATALAALALFAGAAGFAAYALLGPVAAFAAQRTGMAVAAAGRAACCWLVPSR